MLSKLGSKAVTGILLLLPVAISVLVLLQIAELLAGIVDPIAALLPVQVVLGIDMTWVVTIAIIFGTLVFVGSLMETGLGARGNQWLEDRILSRIPGYTLARGLTRGVAGRHAEESFSVALVSLYEGGAASLVLVVERGEETSTIFVPQAPTPTLGLVYVVPNDRVQPMDLSATSLINGMMQWGIGTQELLAQANTARTETPPS